MAAGAAAAIPRPLPQEYCFYCFDVAVHKLVKDHKKPQPPLSGASA